MTMKIYLMLFFVLMVGLLHGCSNRVPDYTGRWEQVDQEDHHLKRILIITKEDDQYKVVDQFYNTVAHRVTYDESSDGVIDGQQLLSGTNTLTNVMEMTKDQQSLTLYSHDNSIIKFKKSS